MNPPAEPAAEAYLRSNYGVTVPATVTLVSPA